MLKLIRRWKKRWFRRKLRKLLYARLRIDQRVNIVAIAYRTNHEDDMLGWGRSLARRAGILAADITYRDGLFCFVVHKQSRPSNEQIYRLQALAFYDEYLLAPYTVSKISCHPLTDYSNFVVYKLQVIDTRQRA
jgi:hypothetical protein